MATVPTQKQTEEVSSPVAPLESVETEKVRQSDDPCWNCDSHLTDGKCSKCGFDKSLLYNLHLEEERAAKRNAQLSQVK